MQHRSHPPVILSSVNIASIVEDHPGDSVALIDGEEQVTYAQLRDGDFRTRLVDGLRSVPFDHLWLRVSGFGADAEPTKIARYIRDTYAFQELGRIVRTVYLIHWIGMDELRSGVTDASNKVESFHQFSSHLRFGSQGALRTNEPDEQAKAVIYNELVANAVMLQTVADQTQILQNLHNEGYPVDSADLAYLSPYVTGQLKRFGEYPTRYETEPPPPRKWMP